MNRIVLTLLVFMLIANIAQGQKKIDIKKAESVSMYAYVDDSCFEINKPLKLNLVMQNNSSNCLLIATRNIFPYYDIINDKGDTLKPSIWIAHSRDWSGKDYLLSKPLARDTITFFTQINLYYKLERGGNSDLEKGSSYDFILTYYHDVKKYYGEDKSLKKN